MQTKTIAQSVAAVSLMLAVFSAHAEVKLASPFADGMVLQRERKVPVWGWADAGEKITVEFAGRKHETIAGGDGRWRVDLSSMDASKEGRTLKVVSASGAAEVKDVLVGEVWYCCGQSNMELPLVGNDPRFRDRQGAMVAQMTYRPYVRFAHCPRKWAISAEPKQVANYPVKWKALTPDSLAEGSSFSALGIYYALELYAALDIPIGVIGAYWSGTRVEPWTPREGFAATEGCEPEAAYKAVDRNFVPEMTESLPCRVERSIDQPSVIWNELVAPWTPFAFRGMIWYQGCSNIKQYSRYATMMHALYKGWSLRFENPDLKFYFVQLAPWGNKNIPYIQEAQAKFAAEEKNSAMAVINDLGNLRDIHPNEKELVAKRLALHALKRDYGFSGIEDESPKLKDWKVEGDRFVLTFDHAKELYVYNPDRSFSNGFEIAGEDGVFKLATIVNRYERPQPKNKKAPPRYDGQLIDAQVVLSAEGVAEPKKLRYLYSSPWFGAIYNEVNLPLGAFHIGE